MPTAAFRIHRLEIEGFKAFAELQSFDIGGGDIFVFGKNGHGKSSVVEAVRWCLFGAAGRPDAEFRNVFYSAGECRVELELEGRGGRWRVQRRLRPGARESELVIRNPSGAIVARAEVFPRLASLGPHEGTQIIFASQQSTHGRHQADITRFDKVLYAYLKIDDVPDLLDRLDEELKDQAEIEQQLAKEVNEAEGSLRSDLNELRGRIDEILATAPWPGGSVPTNAETDARIRTFVEECGGNAQRTDGGTVTREWLLAEAEQVIQEMSATTRDTVERRLAAARASHEQLAAAKDEFEDLAEQLRTAQARAASCEDDVLKALGDTTKRRLLKEQDELVGQDNQLTQYLAVVQEAVDYFEEFSPEECPVCDTGVGPADVLSRLQDRVGSDRRAAELDDALKRLRVRLTAIETAEVALAAAQTKCASVETRMKEARVQLVKLLDDPADLASSDHTIERLAENVRHLELEFRESGSVVASKRNTLKRLQTEARFQGYRLREERLNRKLASGLEPAREALREFVDVRDTLATIREALQESFNNTLNGKLPDINKLMTEVYSRLTQHPSFPTIVVESGPADEKRTLRVRVTSDRAPGESFAPSEVLNGQAFNAVKLVPYFVFSQFQAEALELDCLLIDDPSQSFDTSRMELLIRELRTAARHAQLIVASHEEDRFAPLIRDHFDAGTYRVLRVTSFAPNVGPTLECSD